MAHTMENHTNSNLIGIIGRAGSGKDTFAEMLEIAAIRRRLGPDYYDRMTLEELKNYRLTYSRWKINRFSGLLKVFSGRVLGRTDMAFESQEFKASHLGEEWGGISVRYFLQEFGTAVRDRVHKDFWVNALFASYNPESSLWMIPDTRFLNEANAIKKRGGVLIRVHRGAMTMGMIESNHVSETEMDYIIPDIVIDNNGSKEDLWNKAIEVAEGLKLKV